jgi:splicing factor 3A subunit 2
MPFQIEYPEIEDGTKPRHRFMSSYEQRVQPWDKLYQYLLFAAEPYEIIAFKVITQLISVQMDLF